MTNLITVETGDQSGQRLWLREGQTIQFGRTELGDCVIGEDELMSRLHFAIDFENGRCRLRDLGSRNGTFVNGKLTRSVFLSNGDTILAGKTKFAVQLDESSAVQELDSEPPSETASETAPNLSSESAPAQPSTANPIRWKRDEHSAADAMQTIVNVRPEPPSTPFSEPSSHWSHINEEETLCLDADELEGLISSGGRVETKSKFAVETRPSGMVMLGPGSEQTRPIDIAKSLIDNTEFFLIINISRMDADARSFFSSPIQGQRFTRIADRLILVGKDDTIDRFELYCRGLGRDAISGVISKQSKAELSKSLHNHAELLASPFQLVRELDRLAPVARELFFSSVDAVFVEQTENCDWRLIRNPKSSLSWSDLGFNV